MELMKKHDDSAIDNYVSTHNVYASDGIGLNTPAVVRYAHEREIPLASVPQEIINQYTRRPEQLVV